MKTYLIFGAVLFSALVVKAQDKEENSKELKSFITLGGGLSMPMGTFNTQDKALNGYDFNLMAGIPIAKSHFGIVFKWDENENNVEAFDNSNALLHSIGSQYSITQFSKSVGHSFSAYMLGAYISIPKNKITIDGRCLFGLMKSSAPDLMVWGHDNATGNDANVFKISNDVNTSCFNIGAGIKYLASKRLCFNLNIDFINSNAEYSYKKTTDEYNNTSGYNNSTTTYSTTHSTISVLNVTAGIGFLINRRLSFK